MSALISSLIPPPTAAELELGAELAGLDAPPRYAAARFAGVHFANDGYVDRVVDALREGRRVVFVASLAVARTYRQVFPRATCVINPRAILTGGRTFRAKLAPEEERRSGPPAACRRCDLEEELKGAAADAKRIARESGELDPALEEIDAIEADLQQAPVHPFAAACRLRWRCDVCFMLYSSAELEESGGNCRSDACPRNVSFSGWNMGLLQ